MTIHTVGAGDVPDLEEKRYQTTITAAELVDSEFADSGVRLKITFQAADAFNADGEPIEWGEFFNLSFGGRSNLFKLLCLVFAEGQPIARGGEFDDEVMTYDGRALIGCSVALDWRTRMVDNPRTGQAQEKTGWDVAYTFERVNIERRRKPVAAAPARRPVPATMPAEAPEKPVAASGDPDWYEDAKAGDTRFWARTRELGYANASAVFAALDCKTMPNIIDKYGSRYNALAVLEADNTPFK